MDYHDKESFYPEGFRNRDVSQLVENIKLHQSVELVGMKRVGINNFLRYFLSNKSTLLNNRFLIIMIDLNNIFERETLAFWRLTLKRIADVVKVSSLSKEVKKSVLHSFDISIQTNDTLVTFDSIREALSLIVQNNLYPVLLFNRFDRLKDVAGVELYDNLAALRDAGYSKASFIFTSYRELSVLFPTIFHESTSSGFSHVIYIQPASREDSEIVSTPVEKQYGLILDKKKKDALLQLCGGHIQYVRLSLLNLHQYIKTNKHISSYFFSNLGLDERIAFQSEELWESLTDIEKDTIKKVVFHERLSGFEKKRSEYIEKTGFVIKEQRRWKIFSPIFEEFVIQKIKNKLNGSGAEFTKQENKLFSYLKENLNKVCERDHIITIVWPESSEWGASDWSLDKLVARVRIKLKSQKSDYSLSTIRTRGYKLCPSGSPQP